MNTIRIKRQIESDTLTIPELRPFIGRRVEITIEEPISTEKSTSLTDWDAVLAAAQTLEAYDYHAQEEQDALDIRDAVERET